MQDLLAVALLSHVEFTHHVVSDHEHFLFAIGQIVAIHDDGHYPLVLTIEQHDFELLRRIVLLDTQRRRLVTFLCLVVVQVASAVLVDVEGSTVELPEQVGHYLLEGERGRFVVQADFSEGLVHVRVVRVLLDDLQDIKAPLLGSQNLLQILDLLFTQRHGNKIIN